MRPRQDGVLRYRPDHARVMDDAGIASVPRPAFGIAGAPASIGSDQGRSNARWNSLGERARSAMVNLDRECSQPPRLITTFRAPAAPRIKPLPQNALIVGILNCPFASW